MTIHLTDEQLNTAVCEWLGWKFEEAPVRDPSPSCWRAPDGYYPVFTEDLPNYTSDDSPRRLINEMEASLATDDKTETEDRMGRYQCNLYRVLGISATSGGFSILPSDEQKLISAPARYRVIAFLQTVKPEVFT